MSRATALDWIRAGQALLRRGGIGAVKVRDLAQVLGVTTGSFYHHFANLDGFLDQLAGQYAADVERLDGSLAALAPAGRIRALLAIRARADQPVLDRAMRIWAADDERARRAVARLDRAVLALIETTFVDLGFSPGESRARACTAYAAGIGLGMMTTPWPIGDAEEERAVALFVSGAPSGAAERPAGPAARPRSGRARPS